MYVLYKIVHRKNELFWEKDLSLGWIIDGSVASNNRFCTRAFIYILDFAQFMTIFFMGDLLRGLIFKGKICWGISSSEGVVIWDKLTIKGWSFTTDSGDRLVTQEKDTFLLYAHHTYSRPTVPIVDMQACNRLRHANRIIKITPQKL
jgi:hypothetical protein